MTISSANSTPNAASLLGGAVNVGSGKQTLGADDFLKLLTTQLTTQDPMKPMEDTQFISQMASFSSLEQMRELGKSFAAFSHEQHMALAQGFLGKSVTVAGNLGDVSGVVSEVQLDGDGAWLIIDGRSYSADDVQSIRVATNPTVGAGPTVPTAPSP